MQSRASEREAEVREVLENYNNLERECASAQQGVATELRAAAQRLREDWAELRAARDPRPEAHRGSVDSSPAGELLANSSTGRRSIYKNHHHQFIRIHCFHEEYVIHDPRKARQLSVKSVIS